MLARFRTAALFGVEACPVHVEVDVSFGLPSFTMVGLPDASVRESRDRVKQRDPQLRLRVSAAPRSRSTSRRPTCARPARRSTCRSRSASSPRPASSSGGTSPISCCSARLSLDGSIHGTRGVLPIAAAARRDGLAGILLPASNAGEAAIVARPRRVRGRRRSSTPCSALNDAVADASRGRRLLCRRSAASAAASGPRRRARATARASRARDRGRRADTTCCSSARRAPARR